MAEQKFHAEPEGVISTARGGHWNGPGDSVEYIERTVLFRGIYSRKPAPEELLLCIHKRITAGRHEPCRPYGSYGLRVIIYSVSVGL